VFVAVLTCSKQTVYVLLIFKLKVELPNQTGVNPL